MLKRLISEIIAVSIVCVIMFYLIPLAVQWGLNLFMEVSFKDVLLSWLVFYTFTRIINGGGEE